MHSSIQNLTCCFSCLFRWRINIWTTFQGLLFAFQLDTKNISQFLIVCCAWCVTGGCTDLTRMHTHKPESVKKFVNLRLAIGCSSLDLSSELQTYAHRDSCTAWCSEDGSPTSLQLQLLHTSSEPISLHQAVHCTRLYTAPGCTWVTLLVLCCYPWAHSVSTNNFPINKQQKKSQFIYWPFLTVFRFPYFFHFVFQDEFHQRLRFNRRGLVGMANAGPNDNGSQFFFTLDRADHLNNKHTIFGKVSKTVWAILTNTVKPHLFVPGIFSWTNDVVCFCC